MKIIKLVAKNVKRLRAVSITPGGAVVTVGGKNGAGKSSVLDSIAYAIRPSTRTRKHQTQKNRRTRSTRND